MAKETLPEWTAEDFLNGTGPYEYIYALRKNHFAHKQALENVAVVAKTLKVAAFKKMYGEYVKSVEATSIATGENLTEFDGRAEELKTGQWNADESGIWRSGQYGEPEYACTHPILPIERLRNIDTGELKVRLAYRRGFTGKKTWSEILTDFATVSNAKNIVNLAQIGVSVTSGKRAQNLVDYLTDVMDMNYDSIPERRSVSRLGWNEEGFSPYVDGIVFDGNDKFKRIFGAIRPHGDATEWLIEAVQVRKYSLIAKIVLAASFASALIEPLGILPFFVHLWGMASGTGKTVAQMVAASVWGDPSPGGEYFQTFKSTSVGIEIVAGFLNSIPLLLDELQLSKDAKGRVIFNVYELASGSGKLRSNKALGLASTPRWANCFITSGETPLVAENDGAGAVNRVIEVECTAENKIIEDGHKTANLVRRHYGHAGKKFVELLGKPGMNEAVKVCYEDYYRRFCAENTTEKQAMAAAVIVLADQLATDWIFNDGQALTVDELAEFLKSKEAVSAADRGYAYMCDWVSQNGNKLCGTSAIGDVYGDMGRGTDEGWVFVVRSVWNRVCLEAGISAPALLSHLRSKELIQTRGRALTVSRRINNIRTECVALKLPSEWWEDAENAENS